VGAGGVAADVIADPLECTTRAARSGPDAVSLIAIGAPGAFLPAPPVYMDKRGRPVGRHRRYQPRCTARGQRACRRRRTWPPAVGSHRARARSSAPRADCSERARCRRARAPDRRG
ncbi:MAG: fructose-bisphosphatase class II, partial [Alphaproteobacteria bacterium]|nr:fructose-bisphosphatase class II [Alphaproteobacteria bacterium]